MSLETGGGQEAVIEDVSSQHFVAASRREKRRQSREAKLGPDYNTQSEARQLLRRINLDTSDEDSSDEEKEGKEYADLPEDVTSYLIQPEKATKIPAHHRKWISGVVAGNKKISCSVTLSDERFTGSDRIHGLVVRETVDCIRSGKVRVLVENHSDTGVKLGKAFKLCQANVVIDPPIDANNRIIDQIGDSQGRRKVGPIPLELCTHELNPPPILALVSINKGVQWVFPVDRKSVV